MGVNKISCKTHSKEQLNNWANQNNPNNKSYKAKLDNRANQMNPNKKTHSQIHNAQKRHKDKILPYWAPDYIEYDD